MRAGGGEGREGTEEGLAGPLAQGEDFGLYLREVGGSPRGLCVEKGGRLIQVLTGALWWFLWGGQTVGAEFGGDRAVPRGR